ncbi:acetolactate synthase large subunit [Bosea minatitlanensis]|uniref:Acetolactate synthase large subunit n=1 Tax=Bosea minatitlanensis TaxID=128782 RepID=A0ABW0F4Q3_9HYPH|nr:acetolactate synthase large subunit [Bosea minatitlanensis]MCT4494170.1 acetolactate synthase large subunit [Bosea minatitlanensis]
MNGANILCESLLANDVDVCFANPGTSEMHFVAALDAKPRMRCVLGLFEGVVTGAADGYARMADKPAATLLHLGPGLGNGLANLHNARRAFTPMINIVGDHATYHLKYDSALTSDIDSLARPMSQWVHRIRSANDVANATKQAYQAAVTMPGIATLILPANAAWDEVDNVPALRAEVPRPGRVNPSALRAAATAIRGGRQVAVLLAGRATRAEGLAIADRLTQGFGVRVLVPTANARVERGRGRVPVTRVPHAPDAAMEVLRDVETLVLLGAPEPVSFFAYPGKPSRLLDPNCEIVELAAQGDDLLNALAQLADEVGAPAKIKPTKGRATPDGAPHEFSGEAITLAISQMLPENAIVCDEAVTSGRSFFAFSEEAAPHDYLQVTGGAIGIGFPMAVGAAVACPDRKVIAMQADGSGMYTVQGLWTQAREKLDIVTVVFSNRTYAILQNEMRNVGVDHYGQNAQRMLHLDNPSLDWVSIARGMGVEGGRATNMSEFTKLFREALSRREPFLIEAVLP